MPFDNSLPRVVARKGQHKIRYRTSGNKSEVTIIGCINAAMEMPPLVIFNATSWNMEWTREEVP